MQEVCIDGQAANLVKTVPSSSCAAAAAPTASCQGAECSGVLWGDVPPGLPVRRLGGVRFGTGFFSGVVAESGFGERLVRALAQGQPCAHF